MKFYSRQEWLRTAERNVSWFRRGRSCGWLKTASVNLVVGDHQYTTKHEHLLDLSHDVMQRLYPHIQKVIGTDTAEEWVRSRGYYETVTPDGGSEFKRDGIMNVYLSPLDLKNAKAVVDATEYFLGEFDVGVMSQTYETWGDAPDKPPGGAKSNDPRVARLKVRMGKPKEVDDPPELNLANASAHTIFSGILNYPNEIDGLGMPIWELKRRVETALSSDMFLKEWEEESVDEQSPGGARFIFPGHDVEYYRSKLDQILKIAEWAENHGYRTLSLV